MQKHYGTAKDYLPDEKFTYGIQTEKSDTTAIVMKANHQEGVKHFKNNIQQSKYHSFKKYIC